MTVINDDVCIMSSSVNQANGHNQRLFDNADIPTDEEGGDIDDIISPGSNEYVDIVGDNNDMGDNIVDIIKKRKRRRNNDEDFVVGKKKKRGRPRKIIDNNNTTTTTTTTTSSSSSLSSSGGLRKKTRRNFLMRRPNGVINTALDEVLDWTVDDVTTFLSSRGLGAYEPLIRQNNVNGVILFGIDDEFVLEHLVGMTDSQHKSKLMDDLQKLRSGDTAFIRTVNYNKRR